MSSPPTWPLFAPQSRMSAATAQLRGCVVQCCWCEGRGLPNDVHAHVQRCSKRPDHKGPDRPRRCPNAGCTTLGGGAAPRSISTVNMEAHVFACKHGTFCARRKVEARLLAEWSGEGRETLLDAARAALGGGVHVHPTPAAARVPHPDNTADSTGGGAGGGSARKRRRVEPAGAGEEGGDGGGSAGDGR